MLRMSRKSPSVVIRRVGGLEGVGLLCWLFLAVIRRVGGLEDVRDKYQPRFIVIRRVGGKNTEKQPT